MFEAKFTSRRGYTLWSKNIHKKQCSSEDIQKNKNIQPGPEKQYSYKTGMYDR